MEDLLTKKVKLYHYSSHRERLFQSGKNLIHRMLDQYHKDIFPVLESAAKFTLSESGVNICVSMYNALDIEIARGRFTYYGWKLSESVQGKYYRFYAFEGGKTKFIVHLTYHNSEPQIALLRATNYLRQRMENVQEWNEKITKIWGFYGDNPQLFHLKRSSYIKQLMKRG